MRRTLCLAALLTALGAAAAFASSGGLLQKAGTAGCVSAGGADGCTSGTALDGASFAALGPDNRHLYVLGGDGDGLAVLSRSTSGVLTPQACLSAAGDGRLHAGPPVRRARVDRDEP